MRGEDSFNNAIMMMVGVPLILAWLLFACFVIYSGVTDETGSIQDNLDFFVALIAILGGPALLYIQAILESWKAEQAAKLDTLPARMSHRHMLADRDQLHRHQQEELE